MPFGIKKVFNTRIGRNLEVYVDDMITKGRQVAEHATDLRETFMTLRNHQMCLNLDKCVFGVTKRKCLSFLVEERGTKANSDKIQVILDMKSPKSVKEVQK